MSVKAPSDLQVNQLLRRSLGDNEMVMYYLKKAKDAGARLDIALADKNALTAAKEARDIIANVNLAHTTLENATATAEK